MSANFAEILSKKVEETERPKPLPPGNYVCTVVRHEFGESSQKKTPFVRFWLKHISPMDDVDQSMLPANWQNKESRLDFYLTDDALFRLRDFLEKTLGLSTAGMAYSDLIPATTGMNCIATFKHEINGDNIYSVIDSTASAQ